VTRIAALLAALTLSGPAAAQAVSPQGTSAPGSTAGVTITGDTTLKRGGTATDVVAARLPASPLLPPGHWAVAAAWRAENLGLVRGFVPAQRAMPRLLVARALEQAAAAAQGRDPALAALTAGWLRRFREEFPEADPAATSRRVLLGGSLAGGYERWTGRVQPGSGLWSIRKTVTPLPDVARLSATGEVAAAAGSHLAFLAEPGIEDTRGVRLDRWDARATLGAFALSAGREHVGWGPGRGGAIVLDDVVLPRAEVSTVEPLRGPGILRYLGPVSLETFAARLHDPPQWGRPYLWGMRVGLQPHPRFTIGLNRASIFGGDSISTPTTAGNIARMLVGQLSKDFENQVVSADFRFRPPTEGVLPLELYLEWGSEDESGGWWKVPARIVGVGVPGLPFAPQVAAGVEYAGFGHPCCGNPPWYLHLSQRGGWVYPDRPLGHPLGGEGWEVGGWASADVLDARLRLNGRGFVRHRSDFSYANDPLRAGNLYAPERAGRSLGGTLDAAFRAAPHADLTLSAFRDAGSGWTEKRLRLGAALLF
jgi:hypothetical protein